MKLKAITKIILAGLITVTILALTLIKVLDVPVISTRSEVNGTVIGIYQSQTRTHVGEDRFLVKLDNGEIVQARTTSDVEFRKGGKAILFEYATKVLKRKVYVFARYVDDTK